MRTHEDALRSFKRYLALALGSPTPPLAAVKWFPSPADFDPSTSYASSDPTDFTDEVFHVWFDLNLSDELDAAPVPNGAGFVTMGRWNNLQFWGNPPGKRWNPGTSSFGAKSPDFSSASPGLIAGASKVSDPTWASLLGTPRWGFPPPTVVNVEGVKYRVGMLASMPGDLVDSSLLGDGVPSDDLPQPPEWDVRFFHDIGELEYPACIVKPVGGATLAPQALYTEVTQPFTIYAYPHRPDEANVNASEVQVRAERIRQTLAVALVQTTNKNGAHPMRLPLYDYDGVPADQPAGRRLNTDFLKVIDASVDVMPEPSDNRMAVVVADVRLNWRVSLDDERGTSVVKALRLDISES